MCYNFVPNCPPCDKEYPLRHEWITKLDHSRTNIARPSTLHLKSRVELLQVAIRQKIPQNCVEKAGRFGLLIAQKKKKIKRLQVVLEINFHFLK